MLSPTAPVYGNLATATSRAFQNLDRSSRQALQVTEPNQIKGSYVDTGKYIYTSRLESEVKQAKTIGNGLQNAISYIQAQESYLSSALNRYERMSILANEATDPS